MEIKHPNFIANGKVYLVKCPKCEAENYAPAVSNGICVWCGFDANKEFKEQICQKRIL